MDRFRLKYVPKEEREDWQCQLTFKLYVDEEPLLEPDYTIEIDSFFDSMGTELGMFEFIGGCGVPGCCAAGINVLSTSDHLVLYNLSDSNLTECWVKWGEVLASAEEMVDCIEKFSEDWKSAGITVERLAAYREKVELLRKLANGERVEFQNRLPPVNFLERYRTEFPFRIDRIRKSVEEARSSVEEADMALYFLDADAIEIGISDRDVRDGKSKAFTQEQLKSFLANERRKRLVVACLSEEAQSKREVRSFLESLEFEEFIFCCGSTTELFEVRRRAAERMRSLVSKNPRFVACDWSGVEFDIGIGATSNWVSALEQKYEAQSVNSVHLSREELLSFLAQDTRRNSLVVVLPSGMDLSDHPFESLRVESDFPNVDFVHKGNFKVADYSA